MTKSLEGKFGLCRGQARPSCLGVLVKVNHIKCYICGLHISCGTCSRCFRVPSRSPSHFHGYVHCPCTSALTRETTFGIPASFEVFDSCLTHQGSTTPVCFSVIFCFCSVTTLREFTSPGTLLDWRSATIADRITCHGHVGSVGQCARSTIFGELRTIGNTRKQCSARMWDTCRQSDTHATTTGCIPAP